jgi:hypothetical protein
LRAQLLAYVAKTTADRARWNTQALRDLDAPELVPVKLSQQSLRGCGKSIEQLGHHLTVLLGHDRLKRCIGVLALEGSHGCVSIRQSSRSAVPAILIPKLVPGNANQPPAEALGAFDGMKPTQADEHGLLCEIIDNGRVGDLPPKELSHRRSMVLEQSRLGPRV